MSVTDTHQPDVTTVTNGLGSNLHTLNPPPTPPPVPPPAPALDAGFQDDNNATDTEEDEEIKIATLLSATFAPMPGVTDGPKLWEAAGLLGRYTLC